MTDFSVGTRVLYVDSKGHEKPADIMVTADSYKPVETKVPEEYVEMFDLSEEQVTEIESHSGIPELSQDQAHLLVLSLRQGLYPRLNVPTWESIKDNDEFKNEDGVFVNYFKSL